MNQTLQLAGQDAPTRNVNQAELSKMILNIIPEQDHIIIIIIICSKAVLRSPELMHSIWELASTVATCD